MELIIRPPQDHLDTEPLKVILKYRRPNQKVFGRRVAARLKITVSDRGVLISAPLRMPMRQIQEFVIENWDWVINQKRKIDSRQPTMQLGPGSEIRIYGRPRQIVIENSETGEMLNPAALAHGFVEESQDLPTRQLRFELIEDYLFARVGAVSFADLVNRRSNLQESIRRAILRFAESEARLHLSDRTRYWSSRMNLFPTGISFRKQSTRWGSCSSEGHLSLNWKLVFAPEEVIDYVVIHELAHLKHPNHSAEFWRLVETHDPEARSHRRWLRDHQHETRVFD